MSEGITKEELMMILEVQSKTSAQMERVVMSLSSIVEDQKKILDKLGDGVVKDISKSVNDNCEKICGELNLMKKELTERLAENKDKLNFLTIVLGSLTLVITISSIIFNLLAKR